LIEETIDLLEQPAQQRLRDHLFSLGFVPLTAHEKIWTKNPTRFARGRGHSSSQLNNAFWACSRFSAWSKTMERSPSMTSSVIS